MNYKTDIAILIAFALIVAGVARWSGAAASIVAGVIILYVVRAASRPEEDRE